MLLRCLIEAVLAMHSRHPVTHRLMFERSPRTPENLDRLTRLESLFVAELAGHLRRLGAGGPDPALAARLLVVGAEAQIHRVLLDFPDGVDSPPGVPTTAVDALVRLHLHGLAGHRPRTT